MNSITVYEDQSVSINPELMIDGTLHPFVLNNTMFVAIKNEQGHIIFYRLPDKVVNNDTGLVDENLHSQG